MPRPGSSQKRAPRVASRAVSNCTLALGDPPRLLEAAYSTKANRAHERQLLPETWALHLYLYHGRLHEAGAVYDFMPGWASLTPPGLPHVLDRPHPAPHYWALFRLGGGRGGDSLTVPRLWNAGAAGDVLRTDLRELIRCERAQPGRSRAILWKLLWELPSSEAAALTPGSPPLLREAELLITRDLHRPHRVAWYAGHLGCSLSTLEAAFRRHHGVSPLRWIFNRRSAWALELLRGSHLGVKEVARAVGFNDLQQFNKWMRRRYGVSPRKLRA